MIRTGQHLNARFVEVYINYLYLPPSHMVYNKHPRNQQPTTEYHSVSLRVDILQRILQSTNRPAYRQTN